MYATQKVWVFSLHEESNSIKEALIFLIHKDINDTYTKAETHSPKFEA